MLGVRLSPEDEARLARHARIMGRGKSVLAREWILERLDRDSIDRRIRSAATLIAANTTPEDMAWVEAQADALFQMLDEEDGGYDWGPEGPPL